MNSELLRSKIHEKGIKQKYIALQIGITPLSLIRKIKNQTEFKVSEVYKICEILGISSAEEREKIFFTSYVDNNSTYEVKKSRFKATSN